MKLKLKIKCNICHISRADRFFARVIQTPKTECWLWTGGLTPNGYGKLMVDGKMMVTHRYSWKIHYGNIPEGMCVCHKCDVRTCVNPNHLFLGTVQDNVNDRENKGRGRRLHGIFGCNNILTEEQAMIAKACPEIRGAVTKIANAFNVHIATISAIKHHITWKHLPDITDYHKQQALQLLRQ